MNNGLARYPALNAYVASLRSIRAGTFQMGSSSGDPDEKPVHSVRISAFRMGVTPVTVAIWREYSKATGTKLPVTPRWGLLDDHPVVNVSWDDIMGRFGTGGFCAWASNVAGFRLTLPTEAQFEFASRGGRDGLAYPWGNKFDESKLWCSVKTDRAASAPVVRKSNIYRNAFGLTDMVGNVWQWCSDVYAPYASGSQVDPKGPSTSTDNERSVRGGSRLIDYPEVFRCADRNRFSPGDSYNGLGFRLSAGAD
jgi:formylglycine-generating enzyme required for sulfatase activity